MTEVEKNDLRVLRAAIHRELIGMNLEELGKVEGFLSKTMGRTINPVDWRIARNNYQERAKAKKQVAPVAEKVFSAEKKLTVLAGPPVEEGKALEVKIAEQPQEEPVAKPKRSHKKKELVAA